MSLFAFQNAEELEKELAALKENVEVRFGRDTYYLNPSSKRGEHQKIK